MNRLLLLFFIIIYGTSLYAQKADSLAIKETKLRNIDGAQMSSSKTILENISASGKFSILAAVIKTADTSNVFGGRNPVTVFAPNDKAFEKLPPGRIDTLLLPAHKAELSNLLYTHAIAGKLSSRDISRQIKAGNGQATLTMLSGGILTARINENRNIVLTDENGGQSLVSQFDVEQSNGILHVVTQVLTPKITQQLPAGGKPQ